MAEENIFADGKQGDQRQLLVDNGNARFFGVLNIAELADFAIQNDITGVGTVTVNTGQNFHQGGFTCAVFADKCLDLALLNLKANVIQGLF